jgi:hypothetical protein
VEVQLKEGLLGRILGQPWIEGDQRQTLDQTGAVRHKRFEVRRPFLPAIQRSTPLNIPYIDNLNLSRGAASDGSVVNPPPFKTLEGVSFFTLGRPAGRDSRIMQERGATVAHLLSCSTRNRWEYRPS